MTTTTDRQQTTDRHTFGGKEPPERLTNDILTFPPQPSLPQKEVTLCLLSQLELGGEWLGPTLLAVYWLVGSLGVPGEQEAVARVGTGQAHHSRGLWDFWNFWDFWDFRFWISELWDSGTLGLLGFLGF